MPVPASREKILVVDDDLDALDLIAKQALAPMGYQVATATDGAAAIQRALQLQPDLVIASLQLAGLSGKDLMVALRAQGFEAPVIVTAAHGMEAQAIAAFRVGASDYLTKPMREAEIVSAVDHALRDVRLRRERTQLADSLAKANRQLERRVKELTTLYSIGKAVTSITDLEQLFERLIEGALYVTEAEMGYVLLAAEGASAGPADAQAARLPGPGGGPPLIMRARKNLPPAAARWLGQVFDDGLSSLVVLSGEPLQIAGEALAKFKIASLLQAALVVPMKIKERVVGVILVGNARARPFGERDAAMLSAVADYASIALVNSRLFREVEARARTLQKAYDDLREAERLKDEVFKNVSRELRAPLAQAKSHVDLLLHGDRGALTPEQADVTGSVSEKLAAAVRIVENMAGLSEAEDIAGSRRSVSIVDLAHQAIGRCQAAAQRAGLTLHAELPGEGLNVNADPARVARAFDEYLSNAVKFTRQGGVITVRVRDVSGPQPAPVSTAPLGQGGRREGPAAADQVEIMVADTGLGIPPAQLLRVFERFYQVDVPAARRPGGAGLGLALAEQIVAAHGGRAWAESEGVPGKGSRFYFTLPKADR
jgi:signal transduction histidine kinase/DNA-binding response OmpR family regulator